MKTYSRSDWLAANAEWDAGDFGPRWRRLRAIAAEAGFIYPPTGSAHDDWGVEDQSQRAIVWHALEDNPTELEAIVRRSHSWSGVVDRIIGMEQRLRSDADYRDRDSKWEKDTAADHREAAMSLGAILGRLEASR